MIKRFIAWLKGSPHKKSVAILKSFRDVNSQLQQLNTEIAANQFENQQKILKLQEENASLESTLAKNAVVTQNIGKLLGDDVGYDETLR